MNMQFERQEGQLTKKERRELRRQESRAQQVSAARGRGVRRILIWAIVFAVLVGIGWLVWHAAQNAQTNPNAGGELVVPVGPSDNAKGPANAPITLVEYGDYQCPACSAFHPVVESIFEEAAGNLRFVFRHFPLKNIHPNADMAAHAVEAAALQGKYWEMHDIVFERQAEWSSLPRNSARNKMLEYAREIGLDADRLDEDMDSDVVNDKVDADIDGGEYAGVNSTPSFFVNGKLVSGANSLEEFRLQILGGLGADPLSSPEPEMLMHDDSGEAQANQ